MPLEASDVRTFWIFAIAIAGFTSPASARTQDACEGLVPPALGALLSSQHLAHRLPLVADSGESLCRRDRIRAGRSECLLATTADFDGNGQDDYAVLMPPLKAGEAPLLVTAFGQNGGGWKLRQLKVGMRRPEGLVLSVLKPGEYGETPAVLPDGVSGRKVSSRHSGLLFGLCDSWAEGYFYLGDGWYSIALTD